MNAGTIRPKQLWYSLYAFVGQAVLVLMFMARAVVTYRLDPGGSDVKWFLLETAICLFLILLTFRQRRWARTLYAVVTGLALLGVFIAFVGSLLNIAPLRRLAPHDISGMISWFLQVLLRSLSVYFLYGRQTREWFDGVIVPSPGSQYANEQPANHSTHSAADNVACAPSYLYRVFTRVSSCVVGGMALAAAAWKSRRTKKIILMGAGLAFTLCLVIAVVFTLNRREGRSIYAIRNALSADSTLARQFFGNRNMNSGDQATIEAYTKGLRKMDMSKCPLDFQMAYLEHIHAWESLARSRASDDLIGVLLEWAIFNKLPDISNAQDERPIHEDIATTWNAVEQIALSYGVRISE